MNRNLYIVTGASRGIGAALFAQLSADANNHVLGVARHNPGKNSGKVENFLEINLAALEQHAAIYQWLETELVNAASVTLINNAGMVKPIGLAGSLEADAIQTAVALNITAPLALTNGFIKRLQHFTGTKKVMNISSGAAYSAISGWSIYCATKAALDHFSRVVFEEQQQASNKVHIAAVAPGVVDTDMQATIRGVDATDFPDVAHFHSLKEDERLSTPEDAARRLITTLQAPTFGSIPVTRI